MAPLESLGIGNAVTGVLLAYRAVDTLLEKMVLLLAGIGVWSLAPDRFWGGAPEAPTAAPDGPLRLLGKILPPFGCVVGIYTLWEGAKAPGGAFQGGTILAGMWILVLLAGLRQDARNRSPVAAPAAARRAGIVRGRSGCLASWSPARSSPTRRAWRKPSSWRSRRR